MVARAGPHGERKCSEPARPGNPGKGIPGHEGVAVEQADNEKVKGAFRDVVLIPKLQLSSWGLLAQRL